MLERSRLTEKGARFRTLHSGPDAFVIANAWDAGSARLLLDLKLFPAVATSSAAAAMAQGLRDGQLGRERSLSNARIIVSASDPLPVSADLENGFGESPEAVAETIRLAAATGLVGASIEDAMEGHGSVYDPTLAAERIAAAAEVARSVGFPFTLTARAENFIRERPDLDDTIARLQAYERAGADVLFAPGLPTLDAVREVCAALTKPVNFMAGVPGRSFSVAELTAAGVRRISLATSLYRAAMGGMVGAAKEIASQGTFTYTERNWTG
ncbi:MAG TPA: isocitrate lyase/phosphoenolpyruvate mutase family protein [Candidatus Eisenbacteria bacterium]|nr:isocitrate lyase/phosphoenolpyruvate mutase family protein [Candidatus Eisenbacteria bacterium]